MNLAQRLQDLEARIEALDIAVQEVHPQYANRILDRMVEIEKHARRQANQVFQILEAQRKELKIAYDVGENSIKRLNEAAERHQNEAGALRKELWVLKEGIDRQHYESTENLQRMKAMAKQAIQDIDQQKSLLEAAEAAEQRLIKVETMLQHAEKALRKFKNLESFSSRQERVMEQARALGAAPDRVRAESLPAVMRDAMNIAKQRPSLLHAVSSQPAPGGQWDQASATSAASAVSASRGRSML